MDWSKKVVLDAVEKERTTAVIAAPCGIPDHRNPHVRLTVEREVFEATEHWISTDLVVGCLTETETRRLMSALDDGIAHLD